MMLARAMALELAETGITVNLVAPGTIETDINRHMLADPDFRARKLSRRADEARRNAGGRRGRGALPRQRDAAYVTGSTITVDGGLTIA